MATEKALGVKLRLSAMVIGLATLALHAVQLQEPDADTILFFPFNDHPVGTVVKDNNLPTSATIVNSVVFTNVANKASTEVAKVYVKGSGGMEVVADSPGRYIFSSRYARAPIAENVPGIRHVGANSANSSTFTIPGHVSDITKAGDHTIEFFYKTEKVKQDVFYYELDCTKAGNLRPWLMVSDSGSTSNPNKTKLHLAGNSTVSTLAETRDRNTLLDGRWHHAAIVCRDGKLKVYSDYVWESETIDVEPVYIAGKNQEIRLGMLGSGFQGVTSALRVTLRALDPDEFMHASNEPDHVCSYDTAYNPALLAPLTELAVGSVFKDETHPSVATSVVRDAYIYTQSNNYSFATWLKGTATVEVVSDAPGRYLYPSLHDTVPIATNLVGVRPNAHGTGDTDNWSAGCFVGMSRTLSTLPRFTVEFFVKFWPKRATTTYAMLFFFAPGITGNADIYRANLLLKSDGKTFELNIGNVAENGTSICTTKETAWDGRWHHVAIVYDKDMAGATTAHGACRLYLDYVNEGTGIVSVPAKSFSASELRLGTSNSALIFSALRVVPEVLSPDRFMVASDAEYGPLADAQIRWRLDGHVGAAVEIATNDCVLSSLTNNFAFAEVGMADGSGAPATAGTLVYSADTMGGRTIDGSVTGRLNSASAALSATSSLVAAGLVPVTSVGNRFTAQIAAKATSAPATLANLLGVSDGNAGYDWCLALDENRTVSLQAKLVADDGSREDYVQATGISLADGAWHRLAVSCDTLERVFKIYCDGTLVGTYDDWPNPLAHNGTGGLTIGGGLGLATVPGHVDEARFDRRVLTANELTRVRIAGFIMSLR